MLRDKIREERYINKRGKEEIHRLGIVQALIIFFLSIAGIYQIHYWTDGLVLTSRFLTIIIFSLLCIILSFRTWPWMKLDLDYEVGPREWTWIIVSLLAASLIIQFWIGVSSTGDYGQQRQYALQLLNGSIESHSNYKETPGYYPPVSHTFFAFFINLTGLRAYYSYLLVSMLIAFFIPLISYRVARQLGFSPGLSLFFSSLIGLYGGFIYIEESRMFALYLPSVQMYLPKLGRSLSFLMYLIFLLLVLRVNSLQRLSYQNSICIGIMIGLLGLTQPHGFLAALLFFIIYYVTTFKTKCLKREVFLNLLVSLLIGGTLAAAYYIPSIIKISHYGGLIQFIKGGEVFPTFFWLYGPLPFLALFAFWGIEKGTNSWRLSSLLFMLSLIAMRFILGLVISVDTWIVFWIHRYSTYMFIFLALLITAGFANLINVMNKMKIVVFTMMFFVSVVGYSTTIKYLEYERQSSEPIVDYFPGRSKQQLIKMFYKKEVFETLIRNMFPERGVEKLRFMVPNPQDTILVPPDPAILPLIVAQETGLNISYYKGHMVMFRKETITQEERFEKVDAFYKELKDGIVREDVLNFFDTSIFLSPYDDLENKNILLERITSVKVNDIVYFLYNLKK